MRIHVLQHVPFEGPGRIADWAGQRGHALQLYRLFDGERLPAVDPADLLVVMGGPMGVQDTDRYPWLADERRFIRDFLDAGGRAVGICLGAQLIAAALGATVQSNPVKEIGWFEIHFTQPWPATGLSEPNDPHMTVFHWHGHTFDLPDGAVHLAESEHCTNQAFCYDQRVMGLQFHLECGSAEAEALCAHCAEELTSESPAVQSAAKIRKLTAQHHQLTHPLLTRWLDDLAARG